MNFSKDFRFWHQCSKCHTEKEAVKHASELVRKQDIKKFIKEFKKHMLNSEN